MKKLFAAAVTCIDGRIQIPITEYMKKKFGVDYVDMITEPGVNKILSEQKERAVIEGIKKKIGISVALHGSKTIAVVGHHGCAGNPVTKKVQIADLLAAVNEIKTWNDGLAIVALWVDGKGRVHELKSE